VTGPAAAEAGEDEFAWLGEVADELGIDRARIPPVTRRSLKTDAGRQLSAVVWGQDEPELIFLHGGGQNAHTWDLVALLLGRPAIAIDLPGHGHSSWRDDRDYGPGPQCRGSRRGDRPARGPVRGCGGMSLGGLTTIHLAATRPDLVRRAVLVDVTPGSPSAAAHMTDQQRGAVALTRGPRSYASLTEMVDAAVRASPRRPVSAVRRGVVHNSRQLPDGTWAWRYDRHDASPAALGAAALWDD